MKRNRVPVRPLLGLILIAVLGWVVYASIEFYDETQQSGWSTEALRNSYLAAQQFMARSGIEVTDVDNLSRLDELGSIGTLFFSDANQVQAPRQLEQVIDWLDLGGNVIYAANSVAHDEDLLLKTFEVDVDWREFDTDQESEDRSLSETMREYNRQIEEGKSREEIARGFGADEISLTRISFGDEIGVLEVGFDNDKILQHPYINDSEYDADGYRPFSWSNSDYGVHMMQFEVGSGLLTIVSDPQVWTSYQIDQHDHAYLLWLLSAAEGNFAILRSVVRDSIWVLIRRNATELLIAAGLLILVWVWHAGYRFGRLLPRDQSGMRALGEYFSSVSHYLWHRHHGVYLITPLRQQVLRRASMTLAEFSRADEAGQYELMAQRCDLNPGAVVRAFREDNFSEATFVQAVRLLKHIEQSL